MDKTVDELTDRLSPSSILNRTLDSIGEKSCRAMDQAVGFARSHPTPILLALGAGASIWLLGRRYRSRHHDGSHVSSTGMATATFSGTHFASDEGRGGPSPIARTKEAIGHAVSSAVETAGSVARHAAETVCETSSHVMEKVQHVGESASHQVERLGRTIHDVRTYAADKTRQVGSQVQHGAVRAKEWSEHTIEEYPLAAGATMFTLGLASGFALPASRREDQLMGEARDRLVQQAREQGSELLHKGQAVAEKAVESAKQAVAQGASGLLAGERSRSDEPVGAADREKSWPKTGQKDAGSAKETSLASR
jgi:hypothetical protein